jgi:hypothetical protein
VCECTYGVKLHVITIIVFCYNYVCECTVGVDVGDGTTILLKSILSNIVVGCIVLDAVCRVGKSRWY